MPPLRRRLAPLPRYLSRTIVGLVSFGVMLAAFPIAGLRWHLVWYLKIAVAAGQIGHGLTGLGNILVPYDGFDHRVTLVVMLGAAVLLLDAGAVLAFAPRRISDARRATAALPLIALAVVPSTLVHPTAPSLQGLLLFVLVAFFVWGERLRFDGGRAALALLATAGLAGAVVAPVINGGKAWFDYTKWSGGDEHPAPRLVSVESDLRSAALATEGLRGSERPRQDRSLLEGREPRRFRRDRVGAGAADAAARSPARPGECSPRAVAGAVTRRRPQVLRDGPGDDPGDADDRSDRSRAVDA